MHLTPSALSITAIYTPALMGLLAIEMYFLSMLRQSLVQKSGAKNVVLAMALILVAKVVGWGALVIQTVVLVDNGHILLPSWEVFAVPLLWAITNVTVLLLLFKDPANIVK